MDGEALTVAALFTYRKYDSVDQSLKQQQRPNSCTQLPDKVLLLHAGASIEVHHGCVPMEANEGEEYGAAIEMQTEQGDLDYTHELTKRPVVAHGEGHCYYGSDRGGDGVTEGQMELQCGSSGPAGKPAAEHPETEGIQDEAQEENQTHEGDDGHRLGRSRARSRMIATVPKL